MIRGIRISSCVLFVLLSVYSCKKSIVNQSTPPPNGGSSQMYGDSVFYLQNQPDDYIITPTQSNKGQYIGFPEGLDLDGNTGAINVSKSETGLKYQVSFIPSGTTDTISNVILIAGINYLDGFYVLANGDSIAHPLYNANTSNPIPGLNNGSVFDEGSGCNSLGCKVDLGDGQINLAQTVRNGVFGAVPSNNDRQEFVLKYRINDKSNEALNTLDIKIYYFNSMSDVTQEVYDIISSREGTILGAAPIPLPGIHTSVNSTGTAVLRAAPKSAKPRPPCIFIVSH